MFALEEFRPIPGYEGLYEVSDHGRIKALVKRNAKYRRYLNPSVRPDGYLCVGLVDTNGARTSFLVHRLVLAAFRGDAPDMHGAHLNGAKDDNRLGNLVWATPAENASHKVNHGTESVGEKNGAAHLTESQVIAMRKEYRPRSRTHGCTALAKKYKTSPGNAWLVVTRRHWKHVA